MARNRMLFVDEGVSVRRIMMMAHFEKNGIGDAMRVCYPVQDCGEPVSAPLRVMDAPQVLLSPRSSDRAELTATRLRVAAVITTMLLAAFGAGAAI